MIRARTFVFSVMLCASSFILTPASNAAPSAPANVRVTAGATGNYLNGTITASWGSVAGATFYVLRVTQVSTNTIQDFNVNAVSTERTVSSLIGGEAYSVKVQAVEVATPSAWSTSTQVTPVTNPNAPAKPTVTAGPGKVNVSWVLVPASENGGSAITGYKVTEVLSGKSTTVSASSNQAEVSDLAAGSNAEVTVAAINSSSSAGTTSERSTAVTLPNVPTVMVAPTIEVTSNPSGVRVSWPSNPANGGDPIQSYSVTLLKDSTEIDTKVIQVSAARNVSFTNLALGSYSAKVLSTNGVGSSQYSVNSTSVTVALPTSENNSGGGGSGGGSGGGGSPTPTVTATPKPSVTPKPSTSPTKSPTPKPSAAPSKTKKPTPKPSTSTPKPSVAPTKTKTPTPAPKPSEAPSKVSNPTTTKAVIIGSDAPNNKDLVGATVQFVNSKGKVVGTSKTYVDDKGKVVIKVPANLAKGAYSLNVKTKSNKSTTYKVSLK
jgi:hypothetical protein